MKAFKGRLYLSEHKVWKVTSDLYRHDGHYLFLRRDEDRKIFMKEVQADEQCLVDEE